MAMDLPEDAVLRQAAEQLEGLGFAAELLDSEWVLRYVTQELREIVGEHDPEALGVGRSLTARGSLAAWMRTITPESAVDWTRQTIEVMAADLGSIEQVVAAATRERVSPPVPLEELDPPPRPEGVGALWTGRHDFPRRDEEGSTIGRIGVRLQDREGSHRGSVILYAPALPGSVIEMVSRGDPRMLERMAKLGGPGRQAGAIMFGDLEGSSALSRTLPSAAYFGLIRDFAAAADTAVVRRSGIVGRHAGDGVTAFFLTRDCGSDSAAARAALEAAAQVVAASRTLGAGPGTVQVNFGLHWAPAMVVGRLVTAGRLEVTALGDPVNEAARIEQTARGGQLLASKALVETLEDDELSALELDHSGLAYRPLGELPGASEKARRDAGTLPVVDLTKHPWSTSTLT